MRGRDREPSAGVVCALSVLAAALWGCGQDQSLGGQADPEERPPAGDKHLCSGGAELEMIDDMEDNHPAILENGARSGNWFAFNDLTPGGEQTPRTNVQRFPMLELKPPRQGSAYGVGSDGHGFQRWGAGVGFEFNAQKPYDASPYVGISFWAKRAPGATPQLRFDVTDLNTSPFGDVCNLETTCDDHGGCMVERQCDDYFGADLELEEDWTYYEFSWAELVQAGWSGVKYDAISDTIFGIRFQVEPNLQFDFIVDDIAFVCP